MGCCPSLFRSEDFPNVGGRFPVINIKKNSDESSDSSLKAKGSTEQKDVTPLLEGPTLLQFHNLKLSGSSSSVDMEMDQIGKLLKPSEDGESKTEPFKDVKPDLNLSDLSDENHESFTPEISRDAN